MLKKAFAEIPAVVMDKPGFQGMTARFALTRDDGMPHYALRIMDFAPGGQTSFHDHAEEHEFYFVEGEAAIVGAGGEELRVEAGDVAYVAPNEPHQLRNVGSVVLRVICTVPILPGRDGKVAAG
ncbi:hypothetical protein CCR94_02030 [Rhodoblastus sphagnicola]|uniref:Cupin type-2 domain-containing protein n=1 Tax=Rhodoblastus sphagnicola TaxID=333368 RepID=A0A2S6NFD6_9HYPH|nr:cupin domain-containing protein [Rhodoblastus sphagnicola]MBB4200786.1 mannose-6-phosphate isomerase-like protein (cupin superfamily) [Rhodoblastus sphagnicola]PPQ33317.1 hypothetical protein CCR94_02030 [Rhodoblastus sphagnicola]